MKPWLLMGAGVVLATATVANAQDVTWKYDRELTFPAADTATVRPFLASVADDGTLYIISSRAIDEKAHNALWKLVPGARMFELVQDYTAENDATVFSTRGITTLGNDVLVSSQKTPAEAVGSIYLYPGGSVTGRKVFNGVAGNGGYGTFVYGLDAADNGFVFTTLSFQASTRVYNFSNPGGAGYGNWVATTPSNNTETGGNDACALSALRDIAVVPGVDYGQPGGVYFTSRNATPPSAGSNCAPFTGGISVWSGGTTAAPIDFKPTRLSEPGGGLTLSSLVPSGITADRQGRLWVAGIDSTRRWVKAFDIQGTFALEAVELPSQTSMTNPDPAGAPFKNPGDIALNRDDTRAYVVDQGTRRAYAFTTGTVAVKDRSDARPDGFALAQNAPNPFNPTTAISYQLSAVSQVRLDVFDALGRRVRTLVNATQTAGSHSATFDAAGLPSGIYTYRLTVGSRTVSRQMTVAK